MRATLALLFVLAGPLAAPAASPTSVDFQRDIRPILSNRCFKCHGPGERKGGVRLDLREAALKRKKIVPGKPDSSPVLQRILMTGEDRMPPPEDGPALSPAEVARLRAWIAQGAEYTPHWAYVAPRATPLPAVRDAAWPNNPIDHFILARLERAGLRPSPEAQRATLIRRVYLDLVGLLPTPGEVEAFVHDTSARAYERVVDRLLASPHYGERQARHWLDLARYADSNGYTIDGERSVWPWRDWVIRSLNADMRFDRFTVEQLAGDLLPGPTTDQKVATGFHRNTAFNEEGGTDAEQFRVERTIDRTNTTGSVWLGLTVGCAQCHDHKFDPISQKEYYSLYAFFNSAEEPRLSLATPEQERQLRAKRAAVAQARQAAAADKEDRALRTRATRLARELKRLELEVPSTLTFAEAPKPRPTHVHRRGDFLDKGDPVAPGILASLPPLGGSPGSSPDSPGSRPGLATRLDLARWLVSPGNPLTPRVVVNRAWQQFFGRGIVETENDFGMQGTPPTHPELLDWLAVDLVRSGWGMKRLHRLIVTSAAYRQASVAREDLAEKDPNNYLLGRQARLRLEAEVIRDAALSASGLFAARVGGPGVFPPQPPEVFSFTQSRKRWPESQGFDRYRRGMYTFIWRQSQHPLLATFDAADAQTACTRRNRSNTPLQALLLANDPAFLEIAEGLGKRIDREAPPDDAARVDLAFRLCFARPPAPEESRRLLAYLRSARQARPAEAWTLLGRVLLNLDEFLTRE